MQEVVLVRQYYGAIKDLHKMTLLEEKHSELALQMQEMEEANKMGCGYKLKYRQIRALEIKIDDTRAALQLAADRDTTSDKEEDLDVCMAFVVLNDPLDQQRILNAYSWSSHPILKFLQPFRKRFPRPLRDASGQISYKSEKEEPNPIGKARRIEVIPAPEPSDVYWENLDMPKMEGRGRALVAFIVTFLVLVGCMLFLTTVMRVEPDGSMLVEPQKIWVFSDWTANGRQTQPLETE